MRSNYQNTDLSYLNFILIDKEFFNDLLDLHENKCDHVMLELLYIMYNYLNGHNSQIFSESAEDIFLKYKRRIDINSSKYLNEKFR